MEVKLIPEALSENSLKLILVNSSLDTLPSLSKFLKSGALFQATVLESLPEKNKAIIKMFNKRIMVETRHSLTPGHSFSARVYKPSPESPLEIKIADSQAASPFPSFEDKTQISGKNSFNILTSPVPDKNQFWILIRIVLHRDLAILFLEDCQHVKSTT